MNNKVLAEEVSQDSVHEEIAYASGKNCHLCGAFECNFPQCPAIAELSWLEKVKVSIRKEINS